MSTAEPQKDPSRFTQWIKSKHPRPTQAGSELERYYRLEHQDVSDPVQWWIDHRGSFPRLSKFALDILAIPAMAADCERAFSRAKLTISSQRHSLKESRIEQLQLMKNWIRNAGIELGGVRITPHVGNRFMQAPGDQILSDQIKYEWRNAQSNQIRGPKLID